MNTANPSGVTQPIWYGAVESPQRPPLGRSAECDVCVVGAGIAGLTTAYFLVREGRRVIVLDEKPVAGGESGRTSAHLASAIDDRFQHMEKTHGAEGVRLMYESHAAAIDMIERIVQEHEIDCDFRRIDGYLFLGEGQPRDLLLDEFEAATRTGCQGVQRLERSPDGADLGECIRFPRQARFQPVSYLNALAAEVERMGGVICCGDRVRDLSGDGPATATLASGLTVTAQSGVAATNTPSVIGNWIGVHTKQAAYRTYVVGLEVPSDTVVDALYWDMLDPYHYVRLALSERGRVLLVGGEDHKTGHGDSSDKRDPFHHLEEWGRRHFPAAGDSLVRWSGQVFEPADGAAFLGRVPSRGHKACYVITGDSGMGMTHGTMGARIVADLILGRENPWTDFYSPARSAARAPGEFVRENLNAAAQLTDYVTAGELTSVDELGDCSGAIIRQGMTKLAVYRDAAGHVHMHSAICPHLKCVVRWNPTERSWDCPCHGSRFEGEGKLITGPAVDDLHEP